MRKCFLLSSGVKELSFDELYDEFEMSVHSETNKMLKRYGALFDRSEVQQQFTIEMWQAYKKYDISRGMLVSTFIYHRFRNVQNVLFNSKVSTKDNEFYNKQSSLNQKMGEDEGGEFVNSSFDYDDNYNLNNYNSRPDVAFERKSTYDLLIASLKNESEKDLFIVLGDRAEYPISLYAEKHGISVRGAYKRLDKLAEQIKKVYEDAYT